MKTKKIKTFTVAEYCYSQGSRNTGLINTLTRVYQEKKKTAKDWKMIFKKRNVVL